MATLVSGSNILDFDVCQGSDCKSFSFSETSGVYSISNPGGWGGANNFVIADAIAARITVTLPSGVVSLPVSIYPTFPDDTGELLQVITNEDLGLSGSLPDGIYLINYQVDILNVDLDPVTYTAQKTVLFTCTIKCCVDKLIAKIATENCTCESANLKEALLAFGLYESLLAAGKCGNLTAVTNLLETLTRMCVSTSCGCS